MHFFRIGLSKQEIRQNEPAQSLTYRRKMNVNMSMFRVSFNNWLQERQNMSSFLIQIKEVFANLQAELKLEVAGPEKLTWLQLRWCKY